MDIHVFLVPITRLKFIFAIFQGLEFFFKFGYAFLTITLIIMIWMSLARASIFSREMEETRYPPCTYNVMCTCSKSSTDLGLVFCKNVPFPALPRMVNQSKVSSLNVAKQLGFNPAG